MGLIVIHNSYDSIPCVIWAITNKDYIQIESEPTSFHYSSQQAAWELIFFFQLSSRGAEPLIIQAEQPMIKARELSQVS